MRGRRGFRIVVSRAGGACIGIEDMSKRGEAERDGRSAAKATSESRAEEASGIDVRPPHDRLEQVEVGATKIPLLLELGY